MNKAQLIFDLRMQIANLRLLLRRKGEDITPEEKALIEKQIARLTYLISELD